MATYTRADPFLVFGANKGWIDDELGLQYIGDTNRNAKVTWQTAVKRSGVGAYRFQGGNQGGDCALDTDEATYNVASTENWCQMAARFAALPSNTGKYQIMVCVTSGDGAGVASLKPVIKIDQAGQLWLGDTNSTANDVALGSPVTLDTWYTIILHARGGAGTLTHEAYLYDGLTGVLVASCSGSWAVGNTGSNNVAKWGNTGGGNTTGLDFYFEDMVVWKAQSTNPGPCKVYTLRPTSVVSAGSFTTTGAADAVTAVTENGAGARDVTDLQTTAASTTLSSAASANFAAADVGASITNFAGITNDSRRIASVTNSTTAVLDATTGVSTSGPGSGTINRRGHDADTSYIASTGSTANQIEFALADASVPQFDDIHTVIVVACSRHTGSAPTVQLGVKSGSTEGLLSQFPNSTTSYNRRRGAVGAATGPSHSLDPATSAQWTTSAIDAMTCIVRDNDALAREFRITNLAVDVVAAMVNVVTATASAPLGGLSSAASATVTHPATFDAPLGALTAAFTATVTHDVVLAAALGALVATATAVIVPPPPPQRATVYDSGHTATAKEI